MSTYPSFGLCGLEQPILETLVSIRNRLSAIKRDRASYMRSKDIYPLWNEARDQLFKLKEIRGTEITPYDKRNRLDDLLEDVFMLLSLAFMSVGKCKESKHAKMQCGYGEKKLNPLFFSLAAPAVYAQVVAMKQCFDQLTEAGVYSEVSVGSLSVLRSNNVSLTRYPFHFLLPRSRCLCCC